MNKNEKMIFTGPEVLKMLKSLTLDEISRLLNHPNARQEQHEYAQYLLKEMEKTAAKEKGLYNKYIIYRNDLTRVYHCFVLEPKKDPAVVAALRAYAAATKNKALAEDIYNWVGRAADEKHIEKKPTHKFIGNSKIHPDCDDSGIEYYCSACKRIVGYYIRGVYSLKFKHCPDCGQRIDWGDEQ